MMKIVLLLSMVAVALGGYAAQHGHGWGWPSHGHAGHGHGHGGHGHGAQGWGWGKHYSGWANVNSHQTPHSYNYGLQESGKGYNKYVWQGAEAHSHKVHGHGWQG